MSKVMTIESAIIDAPNDVKVARINAIIDNLPTALDAAELYDDVTRQLATEQARFEESIAFAKTLEKALKTHLISLMTENNRDMLPVEGYEVTYKSTKGSGADYNVENLKALWEKLPKSQTQDAIWEETIVKTNGTKLNALVKSYGAESDIGKLITESRFPALPGLPKFSFKRIETLKAVSGGTA